MTEPMICGFASAAVRARFDRLLGFNEGAARSNHADHASATDDSAMSEDADVTAPKEITGLVWSKESAESHRASPQTKMCDEASPQFSPSDKNMEKGNDRPKDHHDTGDQQQHHHQKPEVDVLTAELPTVRIIKSHRAPQIPPNQSEQWVESPLYARPPWYHRPQCGVPFEEWMFYQPPSRVIIEDQIRAELKGIYAGYVMVESKCKEMNARQVARQQIHDIDVIPFLDAISSSVLIQLQRGKVDPEEMVRSALQSSLKRMEDMIEEWKYGSLYSFTGSTGLAMQVNPLDLDVPTLEECLHGFMFVQESRAKGSGLPNDQALTDLTTEAGGDEDRAKVAAESNLMTIGRELLHAVDKAMEQAKRNMAAQQAEEKKASKAKQKKDNQIKLSVPTDDSRPLEDASRYKKIGEVYYMRVDGRWMNVSMHNEKYQALEALYRKSMDEMHDFFMASAHPQNSAALRRVLAPYDMPRRLWNHGIHPFLEALRFRLPESREHMLVAIGRSYSMMQLLHETARVGPFAIECAGDLARYRCHVESQDADVQAHWKEVAIWQYNRVVDLDATIGRLHHHLGVFATGNYTASLFNMLKALNVSNPFPITWRTIVPLILTKFVAPEGQTSAKLGETLSLDEDHLHTAMARLLLAAAPSAALQEHHFDTCQETHLLAFDRLLRLVAGLDDPKSTLPPKLLALFQRSLRPQTPGSTTDVTPSLVGPASHYEDSTYYIRGKTITGAAPHAARGEYTKQANGIPPLSVGLMRWVTKRFFQPSLRSTTLTQSYAVRPSPELGLLLCQLLFLDEHLAVAEKAAQLLSVVNLRILTRPVTHDLQLWQYLHVLLVVMRSLNTRPSLKENFGYIFHPELMAPLLNILLRRLKDRGGDAWEALLRPEFPISWVPLNSKSKPETYGRTSADAQREYLARERKREVAEQKPEDKLATAQGATAHDVVSDSNIGLGGSTAERLYAVVLPEDALLRGFFFAKETPSPPEPEQPPSEKQIAREKFNEEETWIAKYMRDKAIGEAKWKQARETRKQQGRVAREVAESFDGNASQPAHIAKPDNADVSTTDATENFSPPMVTEPETDYGISAMFAQADAEANYAKFKAQQAREKAQEEEEALLLDPYLYPPGFFKNSKLDWADFLACRYVQDIEVTNSRELRILWTATSQGFFNLQTDQNGDYVIDVSGEQSVPLSYVDAQMPALITRDDGSRVFYVDPYVAEIVAEQDCFWNEGPEACDRLRREHEEKRGVKRMTRLEKEKRGIERMTRKKEEKGQQVTETKESKAAQTAKVAQDKAMDEVKDTQVEKPTSLHPSTQICSPAALRSSQVPYTPVQWDEAAHGVDADQTVEKDAREVKNAREKFEKTQSELETTEEVRPVQDVKTVQVVEAVDERCSVLGEPPMKAAKEASTITTSTTHDIDVAGESSDQAANLPGSRGGVAQLTHAAVAAIPRREQKDMEIRVIQRLSKSTRKRIEALGADGNGEKEGDQEDSENSDGWTDFISKTDDLPDVSEGAGGSRKRSPKSVLSRFYGE